MALTKLNTRSLPDNAITTAKIATSVATDYSTISSDGHIQTVTAKMTPTIVAITTDADAATGLQCDITPKLADNKLMPIIAEIWLLLTMVLFHQVHLLRF